MRQNSEFLLRQVAGSRVLVPVGGATKRFPGMIRMNATGCYLWELLATERTIETLTEALLSRYQVTPEQASADVEAFVQKLRPTGAIEE